MTDHPFVPMEGTNECGQNVRMGTMVTACAFLEGAHRPRTEMERKDYLIEIAWGIIANVSNGDWTKQSQMWQDAASHWGVDAGYRMP